jgi:hypothetical protein
MAGESMVFPSPFAPKSLTLKDDAACIAVANRDITTNKKYFFMTFL